MKKYEILYDWPIAELGRMADSSVAETFFNGLVEPGSSLFVKLTEAMRGLSVDLAHAKAKRQHYANWTDIRGCLEDFQNQFPTFPDAVFRKFRLFVAVAEKVASVGGPLDPDSVNENVFTLRELSDQLPLVWFHRENTTFEQSCCVFSCRDVSALEAAVAADTFSPRFGFHFLACLNEVVDVHVGHSVLVNNVTPPPDASAVDAFAKLVVLASGAPIHLSRPYNAPPHVVDPDCIRVGEPYHQWSDVLHVLSEYNSRKDLLLKFLTIYHAIENFMFKRPIVELEKKLGGRMFSIRDFRRLYQQVEMRESDAIKELFRVVAKMPATVGKTFEQHWHDRWVVVFPAHVAADVDRLLGMLGFSFKWTGFTTQNAAGHLSLLVYAVRNAVVHNKETEFHLTYASMDSTLQMLVESFLIPILEEVCFAVIGRRNPELWYSQDKLYFYK